MSATKNVTVDMSTTTFQNRVKGWLIACFGYKIATDVKERNHRFVEEALELAQANGCTKQEVQMLLDYVYDRKIGELSQEIGGVMLTLAALCSAVNRDMNGCGEVELGRVWGKIEQIRMKQSRKPGNGSPLPGTYDEDQRHIIQKLNDTVSSFLVLSGKNLLPAGTPYKFILTQEHYDELCNLTQMESIRKLACGKFNMSILIAKHIEESMLVTKEGEQYLINSIIPVTK